MNSVIGFTGLLIETPLDEEQKSYAELVRSSAMSLLSLIDSILDFSRLEKGMLHLAEKSFDLQIVLDEYASMCAVQAHGKGLEFVCIIDPDVPLLLNGDSARLREVLVNLTDNAVKFTSKGEILVRVSRQSEANGKVNLRFSVCDTGIGISDDKQEMIFSTFSQVDASTTRQYNGSGLGLAIAKQLVTLMNGEIGVFSAVGRGSEFWFTVGFSTQPECSEENPMYPGIVGKHILVVDSHAPNRMKLTLLLQSWGARVEEEADASTILELLHAMKDVDDPFHALIIDMQMIEKEADTLAGRIKANPSLNETHLVMMARQGIPRLSQGPKKMRVEHVINKPIVKAELLECLIKSLYQL
jgi:CheY-like chemotaxis protein